MTAVEETQTMALLDGRYQLHERVGVGGMAEIYRAEDIVLGRTVAIKLMRSNAHALASPARTQREADALAVLNHPAVVTLLDARISGDGPRYLVMEFVDGPTLADILIDGALRAESVVQLARDMAAGLQAVHEAHRVHRDIKPANILLAPPSASGASFDVKLADFGLAQVTDSPSVTSPGVVLGTAAYIAPEQARGEPSGPAADIYAFGLVLLEALTGERPFSGATGVGVVMARLLEDPAIPESVHPGWADLIRRMTAAAPEARPTAREVTDALVGLPRPDPVAVPSLAPPAVASEDGRTDVVPQPHSRVRARRRAPRRRPPRPVAVAMSLAAGALVCVVALGTSLAGQQPATEATSPAGIEAVQPEAAPIGTAGAPAAAAPKSHVAPVQGAGASQRAVTPASSLHSSSSSHGQNQGHGNQGTPTGGRGQSGSHAGKQPNPPHHSGNGHGKGNQ